MPEPLTVHPWLAPFSAQDRPLITAWFHYAARAGRPDA